MNARLECVLSPMDLGYNLLLPLRNHNNYSHALTWTFTDLILSVQNSSREEDLIYIIFATSILQKHSLFKALKKREKKKKKKIVPIPKGLFPELLFPDPSCIHRIFCMRFASPHLQQNTVSGRNLNVYQFVY